MSTRSAWLDFSPTSLWQTHISESLYLPHLPAQASGQLSYPAPVQYPREQANFCAFPSLHGLRISFYGGIFRSSCLYHQSKIVKLSTTSNSHCTATRGPFFMYYMPLRSGRPRLQLCIITRHTVWPTIWVKTSQTWWLRSQENGCRIQTSAAARPDIRFLCALCRYVRYALAYSFA